jgi:serine/threonine protein kinase
MHRDVKGANVLVDALGVCKLADFGASKVLQADLTSSDARCVERRTGWLRK